MAQEDVGLKATATKKGAESGEEGKLLLTLEWGGGTVTAKHTLTLGHGEDSTAVRLQLSHFHVDADRLGSWLTI